MKADTVVKRITGGITNSLQIFFNAVLFDGKTVIRPEELEDLDTDESFGIRTQGVYTEYCGDKR